MDTVPASTVQPCVQVESGKSRTAKLRHHVTACETKKSLKNVHEENNCLHANNVVVIRNVAPAKGANEKTVLQSIKDAFARGVNLQAKLTVNNDLAKIKKNVSKRLVPSDSTSKLPYSRSKKINNFNSTNILETYLNPKQKAHASNKTSSNSVQRVPDTKPKLSMSQLKEKSTSATRNKHLNTKAILKTQQSPLNNTEYFVLKNRKPAVQANGDGSIASALAVLHKLAKNRAHSNR